MNTALENSIIIKITICVFSFIAPPVAFGWLLLKDTGKKSDNYISLVIPTLICWSSVSFIMFLSRANESAGFTVMFLNYPGCVLYVWFEEVTGKSFSTDTTFLQNVFIGFSAVIYLALSSFGLLIKTIQSTKRDNNTAD